MSDATPPPPPPPPPVSAADSGRTTGPASSARSQQDGRLFPCPGCGADLEFHIGLQRLKCPYCGLEREVAVPEDAEVDENDFRELLERLKQQRLSGPSQTAAGRSQIRCEACGATVTFTGTLTSDDCPYCGTPLQRADVHAAQAVVPVDGVLPFRVDAEQANQHLADWVRSLWFAPNDFRRRGVSGKLVGVYLPFFTFDALTFTRYVGQRGEHYWVTVGTGKNRRTVRRTRWYPAAGSFQRFFDDVLVPATRKLDRRLLERLEPWNLRACRPFLPEFLAGFLAHTYDVEPDEAFVLAKQRMEQALEADVRARIGGDEQRIFSMKVRYGAITFKHLLLPVWLLAYRYRDKTYQLAVNAVTGEVQGERPYSWVKITLAVLAGLAAVLGAWYWLSGA